MTFHSLEPTDQVSRMLFIIRVARPPVIGFPLAVLLFIVKLLPRVAHNLEFMPVPSHVRQISRKCIP